MRIVVKLVAIRRIKNMENKTKLTIVHNIKSIPESKVKADLESSLESTDVASSR